MIRKTLSPAILPASLVAWRWLSEKYAGQVMTASVTFVPRYASASAFSLDRIIAEISWGEYALSSMFTLKSDPICLLMEMTVLSGFATA